MLNKYIPQTVEDFIGPARKHAEIFTKFVNHSLKTGDPIALFIAGTPGVAKSELCRYTAKLLGATGTTVEKYNGTELSFEKVVSLCESLPYRSLFGDWRVLWLEEVDQATIKAQARLLTALDDQPRHTAILCTSNLQLDNLDKRFQSRFNAFTLQSPTPAEVTEFIARRFSIPADIAHNIVQCATNTQPGELFPTIDVRQALKDAASYTLSIAA